VGNGRFSSHSRPRRRPAGGGRAQDPAPVGLGLKRDPSLIALSRDHHFALVQAQALKRAAEGPQDAQGSVLAAARTFLAHHSGELTPHMEEEEQVLLPRAASADPEGAERILAEHLKIHALAAELKAALEAGREVRGLLKQIGVLLDDHVRFEERAFFMAVQAMLKPEALKNLGKALLDRRQARLGGSEAHRHG